jgi:hypothetical protein
VKGLSCRIKRNGMMLKIMKSLNNFKLSFCEDAS